MKKHKYSILITLVAILVISIISAIKIGTVDISFATTFQIIINKLTNKQIFNASWTKTTEFIVFNLRFPRVLLAVLVGAALSVSGILMQTITQNSLADPYLLGVSSGASFGAVLSISHGIFHFLGKFATTLGAFLGAIVAVILVFGIATLGGHYTKSKLILVGVAISALFSSFTTMILFFIGNEGQLREAVFWMSGSLAGINLQELIIPFYILAGVTITSLIFSKQLDAMLLGDEQASIIGANVKVTRNITIVAVALLTGAVVSISGVIGFLGLMVPHICRNFISIKHHLLIPMSFLFGAIFLIWADVIARVAFINAELPIGVVTSFCGALFFIWLMKNSSYRFGGKG